MARRLLSNRVGDGVYSFAVVCRQKVCAQKGPVGPGVHVAAVLNEVKRCNRSKDYRCQQLHLLSQR